MDWIREKAAKDQHENMNALVAGLLGPTAARPLQAYVASREGESTAIPNAQAASQQAYAQLDELGAKSLQKTATCAVLFVCSHSTRIGERFRGPHLCVFVGVCRKRTTCRRLTCGSQSRGAREPWRLGEREGCRGGRTRDYRRVSRLLHEESVVTLLCALSDRVTFPNLRTNVVYSRIGTPEVH